jgi:hypothetical protein
MTSDYERWMNRRKSVTSREDAPDMHADDITVQIDRTSSARSVQERRDMGETILDALYEHGPKYATVAVPTQVDGTTVVEEYCFPYETYESALRALETLVNRPCACDPPHGSVIVTCGPQLHSIACRMYCQRESGNAHDDCIMVRADVLHRIANECGCMARYIIDPKTRANVIDRVDAAESLGLVKPGRDRRDFVEDLKFEPLETEFAPSDAPEVLVQKYIEWLKNEPSERRRHNIAAKGFELVERLAGAT